MLHRHGFLILLSDYEGFDFIIRGDFSHTSSSTLTELKSLNRCLCAYLVTASATQLLCYNTIQTCQLRNAHAIRWFVYYEMCQ